MKALLGLVLVCGFFMTLGGGFAGEVLDRRITKFDRLVANAYGDGQFTGNILIAEKGKVLFAKGYGFANREHKVPLTVDTKFRIGSITKQFTATAIMLLQQEGLLSVKDGIRQYIPDYPPIGDKITIQHLLTHSSGIPNYTDRKDFDWTRKLTLEEIVHQIKSEALLFEPGTDWA